MTDETFEDTFSRLRLRYLDTSRERCNGLDALLSRLVGDEASAPVLDELRQLFHKLSGSGATYGFPRVSELALDGELHCDALLKREATPDEGDVATLRTLVAQLRSEFEV